MDREKAGEQPSHTPRGLRAVNSHAPRLGKTELEVQQTRAMQLLTLLFAIGVLFSTGNCSCKDLEDNVTDICHDILQILEKALLQDEHNIYRSRDAFFYAPNADPVLLKVKYKVTFTENITEDLLLKCTDSPVNQTIEIVQRWTSRGLYSWIDPLVLNDMQMMLPFSILRCIHQLGIAQGNPEMDTFLWDDTFELPTLHINMNITSPPCIPSYKLLNSATEDLTQFVSIPCMYASRSRLE